ncbi:MAG: right-handed parallel beta-helix repeat-containing protein [Pseudomonadota bacterium]
MKRLVLLLILAGVLSPAPAAVHHVTPVGPKGASADAITAAVDAAADGDVILVAPGTYTGRVRLRRQFGTPVTLRSEVPYQARLRGDAGAALIAFTARNVIVEGFDIAHTPGNSGGLVVQIQDLLGDVNGSDDGTDPVVGGIVLRNNVIHDSTNNDLLKINNGAEGILVEGNLFYDQAGSDEHIDTNSIVDVTIQDNVFFNTRDAGTSSFIVIKDSNGDDDTVLGARDVVVRRNVFLNWQGNDGQGFVRVGEDGTPNFEAEDVLVENNLFLGNATDLMRAPFTVQGSRDVIFRNNTLSGDMPARSFGGRFLAVGANRPNEALVLTGNIYSDPTGTLGSEAFNGVDLFDAPAGDTSSATLSGNLYFNGGNPIPSDAGQAVRFADDPAPTVGDPLLPALTGVVLPTWDGNQFADGSASIRAAFVTLVEAFGVPGADSPALDAADPVLAATDDILGRPRGNRPDLGAWEQPESEDIVFADGFEAR